MRISFVFNSFNGGGKERRCLQIIQGLNRVGINDMQLIIVNDGIEYPEIYNTSAEIVIIDRKKLKKSNNQTIKELYHHLKEFQPNIVQVWNRMSAYFLDIIILRYRPKFKYIVAYVADCNTPSWKSKDFIINKVSLYLADKVIGNSEAGLKAYSVPQRKRVCIYNGFNFERVSKIENLDINKKKKELGINTPFVVSMIARIDKNKDYQTFINCANQLLKLRRDITFLAVGKGELLDYYKEQISEENGEHIRFVGFRTDVDEIIKISTITLLLTNYKVHGEGISNSIMESMAFGVPVIATKGGGTPEIISHGNNGFLIKNNNIIQITNHLNNIISNNILQNELSHNSKKTIEQNFDLEKTTKQYIALYQTLCYVNKSIR